jgi:hypothetical protein
MTSASEEPQTGLKKVISELQAKLQEMKVKFSEIRARYSYDVSYLYALRFLVLLFILVPLVLNRHKLTSCPRFLEQLCVRTGKGNECTHFPARPARRRGTTRYPSFVIVIRVEFDLVALDRSDWPNRRSWTAGCSNTRERALASELLPLTALQQSRCRAHPLLFTRRPSRAGRLRRHRPPRPAGPGGAHRPPWRDGRKGAHGRPGRFRHRRHPGARAAPRLVAMEGRLPDPLARLARQGDKGPEGSRGQTGPQGSRCRSVSSAALSARAFPILLLHSCPILQSSPAPHLHPLLSIRAPRCLDPFSRPSSPP